MNLITSSQDILYLVIAVCVAVFTFFICWMLYYSVLSIRNVFKITKQAKDSVDKVHSILTNLKDRLDSTFSYIYLAEEGLKKISEVIGDYKNKDKKKKIKKNKNKTKNKTGKNTY